MNISCDPHLTSILGPIEKNALVNLVHHISHWAQARELTAGHVDPAVGVAGPLLCQENTSYRKWKIFLFVVDSITWSRLPLEKLIVSHLAKNFSTFYGIQIFIVVFTRSLAWLNAEFTLLRPRRPPIYTGWSI
jgi:hypothetical protein